MKRQYPVIFSILLVSFISFSSFAQGNETSGYMFRLLLKDKGNPPFSIDMPSEFLSQKSIDRRMKQRIAIDSTDLPLDPNYLVGIQNKGATIKAVSKWMNSVVVYLPDSILIESLKELPFVDSAVFVWKGLLSPSTLKAELQPTIEEGGMQTPDVNFYGNAYTQINLHRGELLHGAGFKGEEMSIAVIDGGFSNVTQIDAFNRSQIKEIRNFTHCPQQHVSDADASHGTKVLSCMLSEKPGIIVGTAPHAEYYLLQTEVANEEFLVEEDFWVTGIEYADSLGVDVVNSSLGYTRFDLPEMNHTWEQLDGKTVMISRAATLASNKGLLVFVAAGNERNKSSGWEKISFPSDADHIITVGSVKQSEGNEASSFSSVGRTADQRIKPDLMSLGSNTTIINENGVVTKGSGTSFASPILAGLGACLWQALPHLTNKQIIQLLKESANRYAQPDSIYGYGIPDVYKAYCENAKTQLPAIEKSFRFLQMDTNSGRLFINLSPEDCRSCRLSIFSTLGNKILERDVLTESIDISFLSKGIYIACLNMGNKQYVQKFIQF